MSMRNVLAGMIPIKYVMVGMMPTKYVWAGMIFWQITVHPRAVITLVSIIPETVPGVHTINNNY